ncbi:glucose-1-phosphate thymidylyltransferase RfbA [Candidatus Persebacteraceae bacterium Df01]|uniref:Glucose-1-phosphate thymidylyltransferase n=1 Tax=Candidatus Doriopsillibacter californiensis TaxID=2970740 RepID=A0ABT7QN08_9GAMM|nr:glucose-1-phosphate thymidylyltransferase RfbA [Candidatus Persebacteraceae bacterium Df01]
MTARRGILLAGGANTRLYPATLATPKSLLPVYDKPLIYYSLSVLMLAGIRDILVITTPQTQDAHRRLFGDGKRWGMQFSYIVQDEPRGIADAFIIGADFVDGAPSALVLADNIYYGAGLAGQLIAASNTKAGATVFACHVPSPERFGVVEFNNAGQAISLEEKPEKPKSSYAITGCYFYDESVCDVAANLKPSARGELEITDLNRIYLQRNTLNVQTLGRGMAWFDTGTPDSLAAAADFVRVVQNQQNLMIACPEEVAWRNGWMDNSMLTACTDDLKKTPYGCYLRTILSS